MTASETREALLQDLHTACFAAQPDPETVLEQAAVFARDEIARSPGILSARPLPEQDRTRPEVYRTALVLAVFSFVTGSHVSGVLCLIGALLALFGSAKPAPGK